tara:strand:- start:529 stop:2127 length:1599 start_codon:yes stop_codon:yes gene_type:complete
MSKVTHSYEALLELFFEFRELLKPTIVDGVPDFSSDAMAAQYAELQYLKKRLRAIDTSDWSRADCVDYHVVRAEINGVDFDHRVLKPWARDPGFYNLTDGIYPRLLVHHSRSLSNWGLIEPALPLDKEGVKDFRTRLQCVPKLFLDAKKNLVEAAGELATIAIRVKEKDIELLERFRQGFAEHHPDLIPDVDKALFATKDFRDWLIENQNRMPATAGIGKENYNWWMKNVHLIPYTWDQFHTMIQAEYDRTISFLKLEENKNRRLPDFELTSSAEENNLRQQEAVEKLMQFLQEEEIITVPPELAPLPTDQYPRVWGISAYLRAGDRGFFEETNDREPMTNIAHVFFGHYYVGGRKIWYQDSDQRPIRGAIRLYDLHEARSEALAYGIEEWLLQSGLFDDRPRSREITYIWSIFRAVRALTDLKMHANEYSLEDGLKNISESIPYQWAKPNSDAVWWDTEEALRSPGHSSNYVVGRNMMQGLMAQRARQLGEDFSVRRFFDEFMNGGIIPISLTRWELTGLEDEMNSLLDVN